MKRRTPLKRSGFKKKRKVNYKAKLWKIFSEFIRRRDADENGMVKCISCPAVKHWKELQAGHYYPKSLGLAVYFDERGVQAQCPGCNLYKHGNLTEYAISLRKKYGETILEELNAQRHQTIKIAEWEYLEMIETYTAKLAALNGETK